MSIRKHHGLAHSLFAEEAVMKRVLLFALCVCAVSGAVGAEAGFRTGSSLEKSGAGAKISFSLVAPADVEVAVIDSSNRVVRHLAAGVLGGANPPPEPLKAGLVQEVLWDGRDDFGNSAAGAPFKIRVRSGTDVKFGRFVGDQPYLVMGQSIACDEEGNIYIQSNPGSPHIRVFDPDGRYLREILPFPADLPPETMKSVMSWDSEGGAFRPRNGSALWPSFYGGQKMIQASVRAGVLCADFGRLYRLDPRGGIIGESMASHDLWGGARRQGFPDSSQGGVGIWVALSPDGKYAYLSGPYSNKDQDVPPGRVYRVALDGKDTWKEFATVKVTGKYSNHMGYWDTYWGPRSAVQGIACDSKGQVYVCDRENGRVVVFDQEGKELDSIAVPFAEQVAVHPASGAIYVLQKDRKSYSDAHVVLMKFDKTGDGVKPSATYTFSPQTRKPQMVLAAGTSRALVWITGVPGGMLALEDKGVSFEPAKTSYQPPADFPGNWVRFAVDPLRDEVYVQDGGHKVYRFDGRTGEGGRLMRDGKPVFATDVSVGYDGLLYFQMAPGAGPSTAEYSGPLHRYTRDMNPAPYPSGTHVITPYTYSRYGHGLNCEKGFGIGPKGELYVSVMYAFAKYVIGGFGPDGKPINGLYMRGAFAKGSNFKGGQDKNWDSAVVGPIPGANGGVRVDLAGNIYVAMQVFPEKYAVPDKFAKDPSYAGSVGSVVRFNSTGGAVLGIADAESKQADAPRLALTRKMVAEGATRIYSGIGPLSGNWASTSDCCVCRVPRFDLDRYGRVYMPNAVGNCVRIVDNNDNLILEFGKYGNFDSQLVNPNTDAGRAGKPAVAVPGIPLAWPTGVGVSENSVYVSDSYNNRAVRVDLTWKNEEVLDIK